MVLKPDKEFLRQAFTNNTFGLKETDMSLRAVLDNSFSYLYRLQKNLIQYEEYFYSTRNQVYNFFETPSETISDNPEMGDFYLDNRGRVCVNFPVELVPSIRREDYRRTQYHNNDQIIENHPEIYGQEITYEELIEHDNIFYRIPVIIIDNHVLKNFKVKVYDDFFVAILPFDRYFLHSKKYDNTNHEYYFNQHEYSIQIINNVNPISKLKKDKEIGFFDIKTNKGMLGNESTNYGKPFGYLSNEYMNNLLNEQYPDSSGKKLKLYDSKDGTYFAFIFHDNEELGSTFIDVDIDESGVQLNLDQKSKEDMEKYPEFTIRFIFYRYLHKHTTTSGNNCITSHEINNASDQSFDKETWSDMFLIRKNENEIDCFPKTYEMPVPSEDLIIFRIKKGDQLDDTKKTWDLLPNKVVTSYYPNLYQITNEKEFIYVNPNTGFYYKENGKYFNNHDEHIFTEDVTVDELRKIIDNKRLEKQERYKLRNITPGDNIRIYYFYYPGYDLHYTHMYEFFYKYLFYKWGKGSQIGFNIEDIINGIMFKTFTLEDDFDIDPEKMKELTTVREAVLELLDTEIDKDTATSFANLYLGSSYSIDEDSILYMNESELSEEEKISKVIARFLEVFESIIKHDIIEYRYDDIDYMKSKNDDSDQTFADSLTGLEYKIKKLKDFISDDPEALRKYVLCQNKTSIKYNFFASKEELDKRIRYQTEGSNPSKFKFSIYRNQITSEFYDKIGRHYFQDETRDSENDVSLEELYKILEEVDENGNKIYIKDSIEIGMYLFMFERLNKDSFLSCRIFIDGLLYTNYTQYAYDYQDLIYIPLYDISVGSFIEIETFPSYSEKDVVTFLNEDDSVIISYHEDEFINPTLSDLYFKNPDDPDLFYSKDDFKCEYLLEDYNYYTDTENKIKVYSLVEKKNYYSGTFIDLENEHKYIATRKNVMTDNGNGTFTNTEIFGYLHYDSSGNYIEFLRKDEIPTNLSPQYYATEVYVNSENGDYYAKDYSYTKFFHYSSDNVLLEEKGYSRDEILEIAKSAALTIEFDDVYIVKFEDGYYTRDGKHFSINGQREREFDVTSDVITDWIVNDQVKEFEVYPTGDLLDIIRNYDYTTQGKVYEGESTIHKENTNMLFTPLKRIKISCLNPNLFGTEIEINVRKDSIIQVETMSRMNYPCIEIGIQNQSLQVERYVNPTSLDYYEKETYYNKFYHYNQLGVKDEVDSTGNYISYSRDEIYEKIKKEKLIPYIDSGSNEFVRVFRNGRLCSKNRYELLLNDGSKNYGYPRVQILERIEQGETITVDATPYRNRLVYYCKELDSDLVSLKNYIDKPFDIHYFEVYLNGRRINRNNIFPISPYEFKLAGVHSLSNLEVYEKDRDWEYYGCDFNSYYTLSDLIDEIFMEEIIKKKVIDDVTGEVPENHICEEPIEWERDLDMETVFFEIFYYNRLLPLGLANADESVFDYEDIRNNFPVVFQLFMRYNDISVNNGDYNVVIDSSFKKDNPTFYQSLAMYQYDTTEIFKHDHLNGKELIMLKRVGFDGLVYELYTGNDINSLEKVLSFSNDFVINDVNTVHFLYENGLYIITTAESDIYYRSEDCITWIRDKFDFVKDSINYTFYPYISSFIDNRYLMLGEILLDDDNLSFISYGSIESSDGKSWSFNSEIDSEYMNKSSMVYLSSAQIIYSSSNIKDWYTTDGVNFIEQRFESIDEQIGIEGFKKSDFAVITPTIKEAGGIYYAGKSSIISSYFKCAIYSKNGIDWEPFDHDLNVSEIVYTNKAWLLKSQGSDQKYHIFKSLDGLSFIEVDKSKTFNSCSLFESGNGFYILNNDNFEEVYILFTGKVLSDDTHIEGNNVLLLDPDIFYDGDDNNRWNVYFTGNDNKFMDKYIK